MQTIGSGEPKPHWMEKIIRLAIPAGLIYGGIKLFNAFAPTLIEFFNNFWHIVLVGAPAVFLTLFVLQNPTFLWMGYKTLCRKITSFFIKMDPLSFMDRYVDLLRSKRKGLQASKTSLNANKLQLVRDMADLKKNIDEKMRMSKAAKNMGDNEEASHQAGLAMTDKGSYDLYAPILNKMESNLIFLSKLDENWGRSIEKLSHTVEAKRKEFTTLKTMAKALNCAEEFAKGDTEANRIYKESVLALEEKVTQSLAYIEQFETDSKGVMKTIDLEKQMQSDEGLELLAQYEKNGSLFLEEDYSKFQMEINPNADLFAKANANAKTATSYSNTAKTGTGEFGQFLKK
jgi:low affinity Fe/Cu permease